MGLIKLDDKVFPDRRTNGDRLKLDWSDWWKVCSVIIILILAGGNIKWTVNNHSELLAKQELKLKETSDLTRDNRKDIESIKESIIRIDKYVQNSLKIK